MVLVALPNRAFELDRYFVPKELVLHLVAFTGALACLARARRVILTRLDEALLGYLGLSLLSVLLATNWWLAWRGFAVSLSGALLFWVARSLARAGLARPLLAVLAFAVVLGAMTALLQVYGVESEYLSLNRAPGGTFGNRNFMAHLIAIGLPTLIVLILEAETRRGVALGATGVAVIAAALVLSRCRAAWLAVMACTVLLLVEGFWRGGLWNDRELRRRLRLLAASGAAAIALALVVPNTLEWRSDSPYLETLRGVANYREGSGHGRLIQYGNTARMALSHPLLGVGPGNWPVVYPTLAPHDDPSLDPDDGMTANPWPSSDWMAFLAERGLPAFGLLLLVGFAIALHGWRWWAGSPRKTRSLGSLAVTGTILAGAVVGCFDAALLLPVPAFFVWTIAGALAAPEPTARVIELPTEPRRRLLLVAAIGALLLVVRSGSQVAAIVAFDEGWSLSGVERAVRWDPGSYRIQIKLAQAYLRHGRCDRARPHARAAGKLFPAASEPRRLISACGGLR